MRYLICFFWVLPPTIAIGLGHLVGQGTETPALSTNLADISWLDSLEVNLGTIPQNQAITQIFRFHNQSENDILIDNVRTSCGCTAGDWAASPTPPDSIGTVSLTFDAAKRGWFRKKATVWFAGRRRPVRLALVGLVE